jgi:Spy/CpxP family protein refolding chaperone
MRSARIALTLLAALLIACPVLAADKCCPAKSCSAKKAPACPAAQRIDKWTAGLTLTDDQKASLTELKKEYGPKLMAAMKEFNVRTPEQNKAAAAAVKEAKAAGKTGKELHQAVDAAVTLTDEQKTKLADAKKGMQALDKELHQKVFSVLTPEQKEQLKKAHKAKKAAK